MFHKDQRNCPTSQQGSVESHIFVFDISPSIQSNTNDEVFRTVSYADFRFYCFWR